MVVSRCGRPMQGIRSRPSWRSRKPRCIATAIIIWPGAPVVRMGTLPRFTGSRSAETEGEGETRRGGEGKHDGREGDNRYAGDIRAAGDVSSGSEDAAAWGGVSAPDAHTSGFRLALCHLPDDQRGTALWLVYWFGGGAPLLPAWAGGTRV